MTNATLNVQTAPGHQVLAAAGKKILRPGGRAATEQLFRWANFQPGETVLELASSFGYSAIALAQARTNIAAAGLSDQVQVIEGNVFHLDAISQPFDYVLAEAILTMQSPPGKAKILSGVRDRLKPGGKFLSHERLARHQEAQIHQALAQVIRVNSTPLSQANWIAACEAAELQVQQHQTGSMGLLNLGRVVQDEGLVDTARILWNVLTRPQLRERVLAMRRVFQQHQQDLGYIILCAKRV